MVIKKIITRTIRIKEAIIIILLFYVLLLAVVLIKKSVIILGPPFSSQVFNYVRNVPNAIGVSWLFTIFTLSGSPIAAISISLQNANVISSVISLASVLGSRIGATSIVFLLAIISYFQDRKLKKDFGVAVEVFLITLIMSFVTLLFGLIIYGLDIELPSANMQQISFDTSIPMIDSISEYLLTYINPFTSLIFSIILIIVSLHLLEKHLKVPDTSDDENESIINLLKKPAISFLAGFILTAIFFTITISFSILVPLYIANRFRRKDIVPYIIGGNIGTFSDTFLISLLTGNPQVMETVVICILGNIMAAILLMINIEKFSGFVIKTSDYFLRNENQTIILLCIFIIMPIILLSL